MSKIGTIQFHEQVSKTFASIKLKFNYEMFDFGEQFTKVTFKTFHKFNGLYILLIVNFLTDKTKQFQGFSLE